LGEGEFSKGEIVKVGSGGEQRHVHKVSLG
jgi:hypothetical protein